MRDQVRTDYLWSIRLSVQQLDECIRSYVSHFIRHLSH